MAYNWEKTWEYQRILEILYDYWLSEPDEKKVSVSMYFEHADGQTQEKQIIWRNAKYLDSDPEGNAFMTASEILNEEDLFMPTLNMIDDDSLNGWVLCKDRLPDLELVPASFGIDEYYQSKPCVVFGDVDLLKMENVWVARYCLDDLDGEGYWSDFDANTIENVYAWMPLPEISKAAELLSGGE